MARTDAIVLGAGIVGVSVALQLAKRGLSVALVDRGGVGEADLLRQFRRHRGLNHPAAGVSVASDGADAGGAQAGQRRQLSLAYLPKVAPWLLEFRANSTPERLAENARANRPLFARALAEHETLMQESGATQYLRKTGWMKLYRDERAFDALQARIRSRQGVRPAARRARRRRRAEAGAVAPSGVQARGVLAEGGEPQQSLCRDAALRRALCRARRRHGSTATPARCIAMAIAGGWRPTKAASTASEVVVALGPWAPDLLEPMGLKLPMAFKRGYHRHFRAQGNAALARPVVDVDYGYLITPMEQGIRLTTGAEFAARDAQPTPVQFDRLMPQARKLFPLGERADDKTWLGSRPCFPDSRPVIGRAPGINGVWLAIGHAHWGLTLGPITGVLLG